MQSPFEGDVCLVRHGETEWSRMGRHTGATDLALTSRGEEQARALEGRFAGQAFVHVLSSPLQRARRTCELSGFSRDVAVAAQASPRVANTLGIAMGRAAYQAYLEFLGSPRWRRACNAGARPQRLLFASTGTKDPGASDILYVRGLNSPLTINTVPEGTLKAFADHGECAPDWDGESAAAGGVLKHFVRTGIDLDALARRLQDEGAAAFVASWTDLLHVIANKTASFAVPRRRVAS